MPGFSESNITLSFPDNNYFRFSDCGGYNILSANHFKEMDACWYDTESDFYWVVELKDYSIASIDNMINQIAESLVKKAIDSLSMFLSSKHRYPSSVQLNACFPVIPLISTGFRFITIVHCNKSQKEYVQLINEQFKNRFKPYAHLFGINNYSVVEHSRAIKIWPWVS